MRNGCRRQTGERRIFHSTCIFLGCPLKIWDSPTFPYCLLCLCASDLYAAEIRSHSPLTHPLLTWWSELSLSPRCIPTTRAQNHHAFNSARVTTVGLVMMKNSTNNSAGSKQREILVAFMFTVLPETVGKRVKHFFCLRWCFYALVFRFCQKKCYKIHTKPFSDNSCKNQMIFSVVVIGQLQVSCNNVCSQACLVYLLQQCVVSAPPQAAAARRWDEATMRVLRASSRRTHQNANGRGGNFQLKARCSWCILTICGCVCHCRACSHQV